MTIAFIGKGGVGKTTIACATALVLSGRGKTALVSTDFMSSVPYILKEKREGLDVLEMNEDEVAGRWKKKYGKDVMSLIDEFFDVDDSILDHVARAPGVAEEFTISEIMEVEKSGKYEYVVWDTAASSSTMHLLTIQRDFYSHLDRDLKFALRLRDRFSSRKIMDVLERWKKLAEDVWSWLRTVEFFIVTTPDDLTRIQGEEIIKDMESMGLEISGHIWNRTAVTEQCSNVCIPELSGSSSTIVLSIRDIFVKKGFPYGRRVDI